MDANHSLDVTWRKFIFLGFKFFISLFVKKDMFPPLIRLQSLLFCASISTLVNFSIQVLFGWQEKKKLQKHVSTYIVVTRAYQLR